jgi:hypothetical protein
MRLPNLHGSVYRPASIGDSIARQCYSTLLGPPLAVTRLTTLREKNSGILGPADLLLKKAAEAAGSRPPFTTRTWVSFSLRRKPDG